MTRAVCLAAAAVAAAAAAPAAAHGALAGGGGFYAGVMHPFVAWEHLLLLVGLGLLVGCAPAPDRRTLGWLALGLAAGMAAAAQGIAWSGAPLVLLTAGIVAGGGLAGAVRVPYLPMAGFGAAVGIAVGFDTDVPVRSGDAAVALLACAGVAVGVFLIVLNTMALASVAVRPPLSIGVRVAGSWIAAAALLMLAFHVRRLSGVA